MTTENAEIAKKQPKDLPLAQVTLQVKVCYREYKFKEGDARRDCHFGLKELDLSKCAFCSWFGDRPGDARKIVAVSGPQDLMQLADTLNQIKVRNIVDEVKNDKGVPGAD